MPTESPSSQSSETPGTWDDSLWQQWLQDAAAVGCTVTEPDILEQSFQTLYQQLLETNRHTNLTRITDIQGFLYDHLLDSLSIVRFIPDGATVCDIGSGAGFPALPLALLRKDIQVTAVESVAKKARHIESCKDLLALGDRFQVVCERAEHMAHMPKWRGTFDVVTARAVAPLPVLLELCTPLVKPKGLFIAIKGRQRYEQELMASKRACGQLQVRCTETVIESHPKLTKTVLGIFVKHAPTPAHLPRAMASIQKKPL